MDELQHPRDPDDERAAMRGSLGGRGLAVIAGAALGLLFVIMWLMMRNPAPPVPEEAHTTEPRAVEGSRAVTLYFANADEPTIYSETREVAVGRRFDEQVRQVMEALIAGPSEDKGVSAIPAGTTLLAVA